MSPTSGEFARHRRIPARCGALLHAGLDPRRRGPGAGDAGTGLALLRRVRGAVLDAYLAIPHRDKRVPARTRESRAPPAAVRTRQSRGQPAGAAGRRADGCAVAAADSGRDVRPGGRGSGSYRGFARKHAPCSDRRLAVPTAPATRGPPPARRPRLARSGVADLLDTTTAAVNSTLQRARTHLHEVSPVEEEVYEPTDPRQRGCSTDTRRHSRTPTSRADGPAARRAVFEMPPQPIWFAGRDPIGPSSRCLGPPRAAPCSG
jgi:hypothetical protein